MKEVSKSSHIPVLCKEIVDLLGVALKKSKHPRYFDGTFGRGGHLKAIMSAIPEVQCVVMDQDPQAIEYAKSEFTAEIQTGKLKVIHDNFCEFGKYDLGEFDAMLLDLGVSSPQLDEGHRGFSFYHDGPLDMRMNTEKGSTAADIIATYSEEELNDLFQEFGEIQRPFRVSRAIVHDRKETPFTTTRQLASLIERIEGWRKKGFHPATQYFMALRLEVNQELTVVEKALDPLILGLRPEGRLAVLTFHSLEDRIVKNIFKDRPEVGRPVNKKVIQPEWAEAKENSRARSAKLRVFERGLQDAEE